MSKLHTSEIRLQVSLDENRVPEKLQWSAEDGGIAAAEAKAMLLSVWDSKARESLKIDLWTKDMPLDDMKIFFHQSLLALSDTYLRATQDEVLTGAFRDFCDYFKEVIDADAANQ